LSEILGPLLKWRLLLRVSWVMAAAGVSARAGETETSQQLVGAAGMFGRGTMFLRLPPTTPGAPARCNLMTDGRGQRGSRSSAGRKLFPQPPLVRPCLLKGLVPIVPWLPLIPLPASIATSLVIILLVALPFVVTGAKNWAMLLRSVKPFYHGSVFHQCVGFRLMGVVSSTCRTTVLQSRAKREPVVL
jgi:hypothetical protein